MEALSFFSETIATYKFWSNRSLQLVWGAEEVKYAIA